MRIKVSLRTGRKVIASEVISEPRHGDVVIVVGQLLSRARRLREAPLWDFQIDVRRDGGDRPRILRKEPRRKALP